MRLKGVGVCIAVLILAGCGGSSHKTVPASPASTGATSAGATSGATSVTPGATTSATSPGTSGGTFAGFPASLSVESPRFLLTLVKLFQKQGLTQTKAEHAAGCVLKTLRDARIQTLGQLKNKQAGFEKVLEVCLKQQ